MGNEEFLNYIKSLTEEEKTIYKREVLEWNKRDRFLNTIASERVIGCYHNERCIDFIRRAEKELISNNLKNGITSLNVAEYFTIRRVNVYDITEEELKKYILFLQEQLELIAEG